MPDDSAVSSLDLERADFSSQSGPGGAPFCAACAITLHGSYDTAGDRMLCARCCWEARDAGPPGGRSSLARSTPSCTAWSRRSSATPCGPRPAIRCSRHCTPSMPPRPSTASCECFHRTRKGGAVSARTGEIATQFGGSRRGAGRWADDDAHAGPGRRSPGRRHRRSPWRDFRATSKPSGRPVARRDRAGRDHRVPLPPGPPGSGGATGVALFAAAALRWRRTRTRSSAKPICGTCSRPGTARESTRTSARAGSRRPGSRGTRRRAQQLGPNHLGRSLVVARGDLSARRMSQTQPDGTNDRRTDRRLVRSAR